MHIVESMIRKNNDLAMFFIHELSRNLGGSDTKIVNLTQKHIRGRLAEALLMLADNYGLEDDDATLKIYMSREDPANLSNMTTSNAIRTLTAFMNEKLILVDGRRIKLLNESQLRKDLKIRLTYPADISDNTQYPYTIHIPNIRQNTNSGFNIEVDDIESGICCQWNPNSDLFLLSATFCRGCLLLFCLNLRPLFLVSSAGASTSSFSAISRSSSLGALLESSELRILLRRVATSLLNLVDFLRLVADRQK